MNRNGTGQRYTFHNVIWRAFQAAGLSRRDIALQAGLSAEVATGQILQAVFRHLGCHIQPERGSRHRIPRRKDGRRALG